MAGQVIQRGERTWLVRVYLGRDSTTRKRRFLNKTIHGTKKDAQRYLNGVLRDRDTGALVTPSKITISEFLTRWLCDYAAGAVGPVTFASYRDIIRLHLAPALGDFPLQRITPQAIQGYFSRKLEQGLSSTTVRYHAMILHEALKHAVKWGLLVRNPADMVDPPRRNRREMRVLDEEQVRLFLAEAKRSSRYYSLYLAAITTGMRQGELLGLRWKDVNLGLGVASIQQTFYRLGGKPLFKEPKTAKARRTIALLPVLIDILQRIREEHEEHRRRLGDGYEDNGLVFCQRNGTPLHANDIVKRDFRRVLARAGLPRIRFHDLRHCHATLLLQQGVHPKVVQERLGHANISMTLDIYSHVVPGMQEKAAQVLENRLFGREFTEPK